MRACVRACVRVHVCKEGTKKKLKCSFKIMVRKQDLVPVIQEENESLEDRQCTYNETSRHVRVTIVAVEKQDLLHVMSVSVPSVIQPAKRMRRIILSSPTCLGLRYFSILSHKRHDFQKIVIEHTNC